MKTTLGVGISVLSALAAQGKDFNLAFYRDSAVRLRGLGLNVVLDESALCRHCTTLKALGVPTTGVIVSEPKSKQEGDWVCKSFGLRVGGLLRRWQARSVRLDEVHVATSPRAAGRRKEMTRTRSRVFMI